MYSTTNFEIWARDKCSVILEYRTYLALFHIIPYIFIYFLQGHAFRQTTLITNKNVTKNFVLTLASVSMWIKDSYWGSSLHYQQCSTRPIVSSIVSGVIFSALDVVRGGRVSPVSVGEWGQGEYSDVLAFFRPCFLGAVHHLINGWIGWR